MAPDGPGDARPSFAGWLAFGLSCCSVGLLALAIGLRFLTDLPRPIADAVLVGSAAYFLAGLVGWLVWRRQSAGAEPPAG